MYMSENGNLGAEYQGLTPEKYFTFSLDGTKYGLPMSMVREITGAGECTRVPGTPEYVKGIADLRGKAVPIVDLRQRFGKVAMDYGERACFIVAEIDEDTIGLIVDQMDDVIEISREDIRPLPREAHSFEMRFLEGAVLRPDEMVFLISGQRLLDAEDVDVETKMGAAEGP